MRVGLNIPRVMYETDDEVFVFARQAGVTDVVLQGGVVRPDTPEVRTVIQTSDANDPRFNREGLERLRERTDRLGLRIGALENFVVAEWFDVLLDGPRRDEQIERLANHIRMVGDVGIPIMGYNFTLTGAWGRPMLPVARGGAMVPAFRPREESRQPLGMIASQIYDPELYARSNGVAFQKPVTSEQLWDRFARFLAELVPVAREAGVRLALHPDDPPVPTLRGMPRLVTRAELYDRVLALQPEPANSLEFCVGTLSEMPDQDIYEVVEHFAGTGRIAYVHLRNVIGRVPHYDEAFLDTGYVDMQRILSILADGGFTGVVVPDHAPLMAGPGPWHEGLAYSLGWIRASLEAIGALEE